MRVEQLMTKDVGSCRLEDSLELAEEAARERTASTQEITDTEVGDTLAAICEPRVRPLAA